jgi:hypothetical protein
MLGAERGVEDNDAADERREGNAQKMCQAPENEKGKSES